METRTVALKLLVWALLMWELGYLTGAGIESRRARDQFTKLELKVLPPFAVTGLVALTLTIAAVVTLKACPWLLRTL